MFFIADLHPHSYYSRATSKDLDLEHLHQWAQIKGVTVVGTGDFTHPGWFDEINEKLDEAEEGLFTLKEEYARTTQDAVPPSCRAPVRFMLTVEISNIYKKTDKTRKVHNVVFAPTMEVAAKVTAALAKIGNVTSDGRPILGLDSRDLLEIVLEAGEGAHLIPAHIWTPHFSALGAASGFESMAECFDDLTPHIFAVETGLSSDPSMNWRLSSLHGLTLISDSDAHSPRKLMREANRFETELSYPAIFETLKSGDPARYKGTIEFFPEEGKYHLDGHRPCGMRLTPKETLQHGGRCPECGKKITVGVMHRVEVLADREEGHRPPGAHPYVSLIPLPEILGEVYEVGDQSKKVEQQYHRLLSRFGNEYQILTQLPVERLRSADPPLLATAIERMRNGDVVAEAGYDGVYGTIRTLTDEDRDLSTAQLRFFEELPSREPAILKDLNAAQKQAVVATERQVVLLAGAGTGKTRTLASRIAYLVLEQKIEPARVLAVTFTNKAAKEMLGRLESELGDAALAQQVVLGTFHSLSVRFLREEGSAIGLSSDFRIADEAQQLALIEEALGQVDGVPRGTKAKDAAKQVAALKERQGCDSESLLVPTEDEWLTRLCDGYQALLAERNMLDFDDLILKVLEVLGQHPKTSDRLRSRFDHFLIDEVQDVNEAQYRWIRLLAGQDPDLFLVGDPDQSIYSFRGANAKVFQRLMEDYPEARLLKLEESYRCPDTVLAAAEELIADAPDRMAKRLFTRREGDRSVLLWEFEDSWQEAEVVVETIQEMVGETTMERRDQRADSLRLEGVARSFADVAILTRLNAQHRELLQALKRAAIPYQVADEGRFRSRGALKDALALLRVVDRPDDDESLITVIKAYGHGLGAKAISSLSESASAEGTSLYDALVRHAGGALWSGSRQKSAGDLVERIEGLRRESVAADALLRQVLQTCGLLESRESADPEVLLLLTLAIQFRSRPPRESLRCFLQEVALREKTDALDSRAEAVNLLTIHAAKGMEFPVVFVCGLEDGLLPTGAEDGSTEHLAEERRVFYVAMTRTKELLIVTHAKKRSLYGTPQPAEPSRFLRQLPDQQLQRRQFVRKKSRAARRDEGQLKLF